MSRDRQIIILSQMKAGQSGTIVQIRGGRGFTRRLEVLGVFTGKAVTMVNSTFFRGPVTIRVGSTQVAIGFGMTRHILVELDGRF